MAAIHPPPKGPSAGVFWQKSHKLLNKAEEGNRNLGGVNALFKTTDSSKKREETKETEPVELKTYSLQIEKSLFKNLELRRVETGISIKQQIIDAIKRCYNL